MMHTLDPKISSPRFEGQLCMLWAAPKKDFIPSNACEIKGSISGTISDFLVAVDKSFAPPPFEDDSIHAAVFSLRCFGVWGLGFRV
jgi:hypothetical protein